MLDSIERRNSLEWLTPVAEKKSIEELEKEIDSFKKTCNRLFLDNKLENMVKYFQESERNEKESELHKGV